MKHAGQIEFGKNVFAHVCGRGFERTKGGYVSCPGCGTRWTVGEWNEAQRQKAAEADERHRAVLGVAPRRVSERIRDAAAWN